MNKQRKIKKKGEILNVFVCGGGRNKREGTLAPEKGQTACLRSFHLSSKLGHDTVILKEHFLEASPIIDSGDTDMNKDNEKPLKFLGRIMASDV